MPKDVHLDRKKLRNVSKFDCDTPARWKVVALELLEWSTYATIVIFLFIFLRNYFD
jgi:hypothetical protein